MYKLLVVLYIKSIYTLKFILPRNFTRENPLLIYCWTLLQGLKRE